MEAIEDIDKRLLPKHYIECKQLVNEVLGYWGKTYPELEWSWYDEDIELSEVRDSKKKLFKLEDFLNFNHRRYSNNNLDEEYQQWPIQDTRVQPKPFYSLDLSPHGRSQPSSLSYNDFCHVWVAYTSFGITSQKPKMLGTWYTGTTGHEKPV